MYALIYSCVYLQVWLVLFTHCLVYQTTIKCTMGQYAVKYTHTHLLSHTNADFKAVKISEHTYKADNKKGTAQEVNNVDKKFAMFCLLVLFYIIFINFFVRQRVYLLCIDIVLLKLLFIEL